MAYANYDLLTIRMSRFGPKWSGSVFIATSFSSIPLNLSGFFFCLDGEGKGAPSASLSGADLLIFSKVCFVDMILNIYAELAHTHISFTHGNHS